MEVSVEHVDHTKGGACVCVFCSLGYNIHKPGSIEEEKASLQCTLIAELERHKTNI